MSYVCRLWRCSVLFFCLKTSCIIYGLLLWWRTENTHVYRILVSVDAGSMMMMMIMMITHTDILLSYLNKSAGWREQIFHRTGNNNLKWEKKINLAAFVSDWWRASKCVLGIFLDVFPQQKKKLTQMHIYHLAPAAATSNTTTKAVLRKRIFYQRLITDCLPNRYDSVQIESPRIVQSHRMKLHLPVSGFLLNFNWPVQLDSIKR